MTAPAKLRRQIRALRAVVAQSPVPLQEGYLRTLYQIRDDVMNYVAASQSRTAHTLQTELMLAQRQACQQYALRLRNQLLTTAASTTNPNPVVQLLDSLVKQDSVAINSPISDDSLPPSDKLQKCQFSCSTYNSTLPLDSGSDFHRYIKNNDGVISYLDASTPRHTSLSSSSPAPTQKNVSGRLSDLTNILPSISVRDAAIVNATSTKL